MTFQYRSPYRPLDIGYAARRCDVEIDWEYTDYGNWARDKRYGFKGELDARFVKQVGLERVPEADVRLGRSE